MLSVEFYPSQPYFFFYFFNVCLFSRETEPEQRRGRESGRHKTQSKLQALSYQHRAWCGAWTHELWEHDLNWSQTLNWQSSRRPKPTLLLTLHFLPNNGHLPLVLRTLVPHWDCSHPLLPFLQWKKLSSPHFLSATPARHHSHIQAKWKYQR